MRTLDFYNIVAYINSLMAPAFPGHNALRTAMLIESASSSVSLWGHLNLKSFKEPGLDILLTWLLF